VEDSVTKEPTGEQYVDDPIPQKAVTDAGVDNGLDVRLDSSYMYGTENKSMV
jgi:hypothetical protein